IEEQITTILEIAEIRSQSAALAYRGPLGANFSYLENRCEIRSQRAAIGKRGANWLVLAFMVSQPYLPGPPKAHTTIKLINRLQFNVTCEFLCVDVDISSTHARNGTKSFVVGRVVRYNSNSARRRQR